MKYADLISKFVAGESAKSGNYESTGNFLFLFGNKIAERIVENNIARFVVTTAGHASNTTIKALNCLPGVSVYTKNRQLYLNEKHWDGEKICV